MTRFDLTGTADAATLTDRRWPRTLQLWLWPGWIIVLALWTAALLRPEPAQFSHDHLPSHLGFFFAKALHITAYAGLTASGFILALSAGSWRWFPVALLSVQGVLTEYLQGFVPLRTGCWQDVLIDHVGIAAGLLVAWAVERGRLVRWAA